MIYKESTGAIQFEINFQDDSLVTLSLKNSVIKLQYTLGFYQAEDVCKMFQRHISACRGTVIECLKCGDGFEKKYCHAIKLESIEGMPALYPDAYICATCTSNLMSKKNNEKNPT